MDLIERRQAEVRIPPGKADPALYESLFAHSDGRSAPSGPRDMETINEGSTYGAERADWGLSRYVEQVALGLGVGMESAYCTAEPPANAYLALTQRLPTAPEHDVALVWDATHGWRLGLETHADQNVRTVSYLGGEKSLVEPNRVVEFVKTLLAGQDAGQSVPPAIRHAVDITTQLAAYSPADGET